MFTMEQDVLHPCFELHCARFILKRRALETSFATWVRIDAVLRCVRLMRSVKHELFASRIGFDMLALTHRSAYST